MALQPERAAARAPPAPGRCPATPRWRTGPPRGARQVRRENRRSRRTLRTARPRGEPRPAFRRTPTTTRLTACAARMAGGLPPFALATAYRIVYGIATSYLVARLAPDRPMLHALVRRCRRRLEHRGRRGNVGTRA